MSDVSELIRALADLAWPLVVLFLVWALRHELSGLVRRLREIDLPGAHATLDPELSHLDRSAKAAADALPPAEPVQIPARLAPSPEPESEALPHDEEDGEGGTGPPVAQGGATDLLPRHSPLIGDEVDPGTNVAEILEEAARSPKVGLMALSAEIERQVRILNAVRGHVDSRSQSLQQRLRPLDLPADVMHAVSEFRTVRNRIVHGYDASPDDVYRAIDSGLTILDAINRVPREVNYVYAPSVDIYADPEGAHLREDVHGVMLQTVNPSGESVLFRVLPTTRTHFRKGEQVAWEWNSNRQWGESWFRHPDTGEIEYGWTTSLEFVGRHVADL